MAESITPDADFSEAVDNTGEMVQTLRESMERRFQKVMGGEQRGDKQIDILRSVEKLMFAQLNALTSINETLRDQRAIAAEAIEEQERRADLESVSEKKGGGLLSPIDIDGFSGAVKDALGVKDGADLATKLGVAVGGAFAAKGFFSELFRIGAEKLGFDDDTADVAAQAGGSGGIGGALAALFSKEKGIKGRAKSGLKGFIAGSVASLVAQAVKATDFDGDGKILGADKETVGLVTEGIAGIGIFAASGKMLGALGTKLKGLVGKGVPQPGSSNFRGPMPQSGLDKAKDLAKTTKDAVSKGAKGAADVAKNVVKSPVGKTVTKAVGGLNPVTKVAQSAMPGAIRVATNSGVIGPSGTMNTVGGVGEKLKSLKPERFAKYAKFFKFAGPAAGIIPALIEPALAIYNDEPDEVVRREIAGALGSVGGASLGMIAGSSIGGTLGLGAAGVGAVPGGIIGGFLGGVAGAFGGEWLLEKMTDALMGGPDVNPEDMNKINEELSPKSDGAKSSGSKKKPSENVSAKVTTTKSAELQAAEDKESQTKQAMKDFETENADIMTREDLGGGMYRIKFSDAEKQKEYDALEDQAILDREAVERQEVRDAVDSGEFTSHYGRQNRLEDFRENEAASLNALKELKAAEKARDDAKMEAENTQDPILKEKAKAKAEELRLAAIKAKNKYRDANQAQLGKDQDVDGYNHNDQMETLMTQYNMTEAEMNELGIYKAQSDFLGPTMASQDNLKAFKRQKDEEKLAKLSTSITDVAGIESNPEKALSIKSAGQNKRLLAKTKEISGNAVEKEANTGKMQASLMTKQGDTIDARTQKGGDSTTVVFQNGSSDGSLANPTFCPIPQTVPS